MMLVAILAAATVNGPSDFKAWAICYEGDQGIYVANGDGSGGVLLAKGGRMPKWSPDKKRIVFVKGTTVWVVGRDGKNATMIYDGADDITGLAWGSPLAPPRKDWYDRALRRSGTILIASGPSVLFVDVFPREFGPANEFSQLDAPWEAIFFCPAISPDGKSVAISVNGDVWLATSEEDGWEFTRIAALAVYDQPSYRASRENYYVLELDWAPSGKTLAYCLRRWGGSGYQSLGLLRPDLRKPYSSWIATPLDETSVGAAYSPDGAWILSDNGAISQDGRQKLLPWFDGRSADW